MDQCQASHGLIRVGFSPKASSAQVVQFAAHWSLKAKAHSTVPTCLAGIGTKHRLNGWEAKAHSTVATCLTGIGTKHRLNGWEAKAHSTVPTCLTGIGTKQTEQLGGQGPQHSSYLSGRYWYKATTERLGGQGPQHSSYLSGRYLYKAQTERLGGSHQQLLVEKTDARFC